MSPRMQSVINPLSSAGHLRTAIASVTTESDKAEKRATAMIEKLRNAEFVSETDINNIEYNLNNALHRAEEAKRMLLVFADRYLTNV